MSALLDSANLDLASTPGLPPVAPVAASSYQAPPPPAAIPTAQQARVLNGVHTEVLVQVYADRILVIVTQLGRIGCMIQVSPPPASLPAPPPPPPPASATNGTSSALSILSSLPPPHPSTVLSPLFGVPPNAHLAALHDLYAAQIGAIAFRRFGGAGEDILAGGGIGGPLGSQSRPVVVGLGLKPAPGSASSGSQRPEGEEEQVGLSERDKETFAEVMEMVIECLA
ncbi:hypothetical protein JCM10908_003822 [Rhodotorula pacifica]|uniref:uncharacterized protein n=1 Tax=Rhodotorula pacifica TaxID=1495444 RepID=UPI0031762E83